MVIKTSWCTYKDKKSDKPDIKYLKNIRKKLDWDNRKREVGEIDFLKIPCKDLLKVLQDVEGLELKSKVSDYGEYEYPEELEEFDYTLTSKYKMYYRDDLLGLLKEYLQVVEGTKKYQTFVKILNLTCKLEYRDYDNYEYCDYDEHPHPGQEDIDHNYVGNFTFTIKKPIPMKVIGAILKEIKDHRKSQANAEADRYDKKNTSPELDELAEQLIG